MNRRPFISMKPEKSIPVSGSVTPAAIERAAREITAFVYEPRDSHNKPVLPFWPHVGEQQR